MALLSIDERHVRRLGRRIDLPGQRLTWHNAREVLKEGEEIVLLSAFRIFPLYGFVIWDKKTFDDLVGHSRTRGIFAAGPELLALQEKFVPYNGP